MDRYLHSKTLFSLAFFQLEILVIDRFDWHANSDYCSMNITTWRNKDGTSLINCRFEQFMDFEKEMFFITLKSQKSKSDDGYSNLIFKSTIDVCKLSQGVVANFLVKVVLETIKDHANFTVSCPFKKLSVNSIHRKVADEQPDIF
ncbi:hypothetical protein ACKWTF_001023 [Chironomus riparius]